MARQVLWTISLVFTVLGILAGCQRAPAPDDQSGGGAASSEQADESVPPEIQRLLESVARRQSRGLAGATTTVHRAFEYTEDSFIAPLEGAKLVAVDVEFQGHSRDFDLDDVDVIDAATNENYGSDPEIRLLRSDGSLEPNEAKWDAPQESLRVLLVYAVPKETNSIKLGYWESELTPKPIAVGQGALKYDESQIFDGVEFWPYPVSTYFDDVWQRGKWLIVELRSDEGVAVVDLEAWPPVIHHWDCNLLKAIEPSLDGGWVVITRTGQTSDDIRFPVWRHPKDKPGDSPLEGEAVSPTGFFRGIAVVDESTFVFDDDTLYRFEDGALNRVEISIEARDTADQADDEKRTAGQISLAGGKHLLLWDGDGYELVDGQLRRTWPLGIAEPWEFMSVPWGQDGFYYLEGRRVYRVKRGAPREHVMTGVENVMGIRPGPEDGLLINLGNNDAGFLGGLWFPDEDAYIPVSIQQLSGKLTSFDVSTIHWSAATRRFYFVGRRGVFTVPDARLLDQPHVKLTLQP